jgi:hypothetical protein
VLELWTMDADGRALIKIVDGGEMDGVAEGSAGRGHGRGWDEPGRIWEALLAWLGTGREGDRVWGRPSWEAGRAWTTMRWMGSRMGARGGDHGWGGMNGEMVDVTKGRGRERGHCWGHGQGQAWMGSRRGSRTGAG